MSWEEAQEWVQSLTIGGDGWRMPTLDELKILSQKNTFLLAGDFPDLAHLPFYFMEVPHSVGISGAYRSAFRSPSI
jgi:hypothetical protein